MTEERILDFLDGNLGASEEEELLHRLAVSPERRNLLKQHLQMRELTAAMARNSYVTVPKVVTAALFTTLAANGYAGPSMPAAAESLEAIKFASNRSLDRAAENIIASRPVGIFASSSLVVASVVSFIMGAAALYLVLPGAQQQKATSSVSNLSQDQNSTIQPVKVDIASSSVTSSVQGGPVQIPRNPATRNVKIIDQNFASTDIGGQNNSPATDFDNNGQSVSAFIPNNYTSLPSIEGTEAKYPSVIVASSDIHGSNMTPRNPFDPVQLDPVSERSFLQRLTISVRAGEGKAPGNDQALTGSLAEVKASYDLSDIFDVKISTGYFMPYEKQAVTADPGFNRDGFRLLQLTPILQYRAIVGAEIGAKFTMFDSPFELSGGFITDLQGNIIPRLGFFTSLSLQDNLSMNIGLEGMLYPHDISSSLQNAQALYAGEHPLLIGQLQNKETTGFIGPSIEMVYHF